MYTWIKVFFLSAIPLIEQRGAIPLGFFYQMPALTVFITALLGSLLPAPFILLLFNKIYEFLTRFKIFAKLIEIINKKIDKNKALFEKYQELALIIFIAIPLPTTGIWTGCAIAAFLKLDPKKAIVCAAVGGTISASIITLLCVWIPSLF